MTTSCDPICLQASQGHRGVPKSDDNDRCSKNRENASETEGASSSDSDAYKGYGDEKQNVVMKKRSTRNNSMMQLPNHGPEIALLEYLRRGNKQPSMWEDLAHDIKMTFLLIPSFLMILPQILLVFLCRYWLQIFEGKDERQLHFWIYFMMMLNYVISILMYYMHVFSLARVLVGFVVYLCVPLGVAAVVLSLIPAVESTPYTSQLLESFSFAFGSFCFIPIVNVRGKSVRFVLAASLAIFCVAFVNVSIFVWYFCIAIQLKNMHWALELGISGFIYPLLIAVAGRVMICDLTAYVTRSLAGVDDIWSLSYWTRLTKLNFHLTSQMVMFQFGSRASFIVALLSNIFFESAALFVNSKLIVSGIVSNQIMKSMKQSSSQVVPLKSRSESQLLQREDSSGKGFLQSWFNDGLRINRKAKFAAFYFNEMVTEKLGVFVIIIVVVGFQVLETFRNEVSQNLNFLPIEEIVLRGFILMAFEILEDLLKKRVLWHSCRISVPLTSPNLKPFELIILGFLASTSISFLLLGDRLARTYFP